MAELSERWTVNLEVWSMQVQTPSEIFCFYFYSSPTNKIIFIRRETLLIKIFIIRRKYKPEDLFRPEVATNLQLNRKFRPLFII